MADPQRDPLLLPLAATSDLRRRLFGGGRRHRRRAGLPLPTTDRSTTFSDPNAGLPLPTVHATILEDIVRYTLSNLHSIHESLLYWKSRAGATALGRMYSMLFERGPRAFLETARHTLAGLGDENPSQHLLYSAGSMLYTRIHALERMQDCLADFLAEVYSKADRITSSSDHSMRALFAALNTVFLKLELSLGNLAEAPTAGTAATPPPPRIFQRLPEADDVVESSAATSLVYQNLLRLDVYISEKIAVHHKPKHTTIYWLPYTCGAIGLSACSLWLLRHSSLMGSSSDTDKESVAGYWDQHAVKLFVYLKDGLYNTFKGINPLISTKQDVRDIEASVQWCKKELMLLPQNPPSRKLALVAMPTEEIMYDLERKLLELNLRLLELHQIIERTLRAIPSPAFLSLLLLILLRSLFSGYQDEEKSRLPQRLLLHHAELWLWDFRKCLANGMEEKANSRFGLMLCELDRLYGALESRTRKTAEWPMVREDIVALAKPRMRMADRFVVLRRLKENYYCLIPSPSPYPQDVVDILSERPFYPPSF